MMERTNFSGPSVDWIDATVAGTVSFTIVERTNFRWCNNADWRNCDSICSDFLLNTGSTGTWCSTSMPAVVSVAVLCEWHWMRRDLSHGGGENGMEIDGGADGIESSRQLQLQSIDPDRQHQHQRGRMMLTGHPFGARVGVFVGQAYTQP